MLHFVVVSFLLLSYSILLNNRILKNILEVKPYRYEHLHTYNSIRNRINQTTCKYIHKLRASYSKAKQTKGRKKRYTIGFAGWECALSTETNKCALE